MYYLDYLDYPNYFLVVSDYVDHLLTMCFACNLQEKNAKWMIVRNLLFRRAFAGRMAVASAVVIKDVQKNLQLVRIPFVNNTTKS